jgi:hypothetical protein
LNPKQEIGVMLMSKPSSQKQQKKQLPQLQLDAQFLRKLKARAHHFYTDKNIPSREEDSFLAYCYCRASLEMVAQLGIEIEVNDKYSSNEYKKE